jgi:prolyl-tRNA synthetase
VLLPAIIFLVSNPVGWLPLFWLCLGSVGAEIPELVRAIQTSLFRAALDERERRTLRNPGSYAEMIGYLREARGFVSAAWCGSRECEARLKDESSATIRCLPLGEQQERSGACRCCGRDAVHAAVWAQAY